MGPYLFGLADHSQEGLEVVNIVSQAVVCCHLQLRETVFRVCILSHIDVVPLVRCSRTSAGAIIRALL